MFAIGNYTDKPIFFKALNTSDFPSHELDGNFIDGVDIFGYIDSPVTLCVTSGIVDHAIFYDASQSPRIPMEIQTYHDTSNRTCTSITVAGSLAFVANMERPPAMQTPAAETPLQNCQVVTTNILNLHPSPTGDTVTDLVPFGQMLTATSLSSNGYFRVEFNGQSGYISKDYVQQNSNCGQ